MSWTRVMIYSVWMPILVENTGSMGNTEGILDGGAVPARMITCRETHGPPRSSSWNTGWINRPQGSPNISLQETYIKNPVTTKAKARQVLSEWVPSRFLCLANLPYDRGEHGSMNLVSPSINISLNRELRRDNDEVLSCDLGICRAEWAVKCHSIIEIARPLRRLAYPVEKDENGPTFGRTNSSRNRDKALQASVRQLYEGHSYLLGEVASVTIILAKERKALKSVG